MSLYLEDLSDDYKDYDDDWYGCFPSISGGKCHLCGLSYNKLTHVSSMLLCNICLEQDESFDDEALYDDWAYLQRFENEGLDEQHALQEAFKPVRTRKQLEAIWHKKSWKPHNHWQPKRRIVLSVVTETHATDFGPYVRTTVTLSKGHGSHNFGRKPRNKNRNPLLRQMLQAKWKREASELDNNLAYQEAMWEQSYLHDLEYAWWGPEDDSTEDAAYLPATAHDYWPEVYDLESPKARRFAA